MNTHTLKWSLCPGLALAAAAIVGMGQVRSVGDSTPMESSWKGDTAWNQGKAEWALYDAQRVIYGVARRYEATIFTDREWFDPVTSTKADDPKVNGAVEVFKHNISEIIPTENYAYRFLTTSYVRADSLELIKLTMSSQEDCGSTYKDFTVRGGVVHAQSHCYFPGTGFKGVTFDADGRLAFHDALTFSLRAADGADHPPIRMQLVRHQTDTHETRLEPVQAQWAYVGREVITVPYGQVDTLHLRLEHPEDGGVNHSEYWFAADEPTLRHVLVKYDGPYGVKYELKKLAWWKYWDRTQPRPK